LWVAAVVVSLAVHGLLSWRLGSGLSAASAVSSAPRVIALIEEAADDPEIMEPLKFEQPLAAPPPEVLVPTRVSIVVPDIAATALRAARGGGPVVTGPGSGSLLPGPAGERAGTGLGEAADQFARYVEDLREAGLDVVFVVDATGSMAWAIDEVKNRIVDVVDWVRDLVPIARFGIVAYRDADDPQFEVSMQPLTYSATRLARFLAGLSAAGGGDLGEGVLAGLRVGVNEAGWRPAGKRLMILVGDAPPHRDELDALERVVTGFRAAGGQITTLDVSDEANPALLEARLGRRVNRALYRAAPGYDFQRIAELGGGDAATLDGELRLTRRLVNLIFGERYAAELALALEAMES
jgi:Mg-chelatase subunit ChlD